MPRLYDHAYFADRHGLEIIPVEDLTLQLLRDGDDSTIEPAPGTPPPSQKRLSDLEAIAVPPAWQDVRFAPSAKAHLQVVGTDANGRRQYIYHEQWQQVRDAVKAHRLLRFGRCLPRIRRRIDKDLDRNTLDRRVVTASAAALLDRKLVRPGNEKDAKTGTTGATTVKRSHVKVEKSKARFRYRGKSGKRIEFTVRGKRLMRKLKMLKKSGGERLFSKRRDGDGFRLSSRSLNDYLNDSTSIPVSSKDFRTFGASAIALEALCETQAEKPEATPPQRNRAVSGVMKEVSQHLRNTPSVARSSYVHPTIVTAYLDGALDPGLIKGRRRERLSSAETGLMRFLEEQVEH